MFAGLVLSACGRGEPATTTTFDTCLRNGEAFFAFIGSWPTLSDGRDAREVVHERCLRSPEFAFPQPEVTGESPAAETKALGVPWPTYSPYSAPGSRAAAFEEAAMSAVYRRCAATYGWRGDVRCAATLLGGDEETATGAAPFVVEVDVRFEENGNRMGHRLVTYEVEFVDQHPVTLVSNTPGSAVCGLEVGVKAPL